MREGIKWRVGLSLMSNFSFSCFARRFFVLSVSVFLGFLFAFLHVDAAYAANNLARYDGVVYGPSYIVTSLSASDYNSMQWVIVNAPDRFSAAVYAVGGDPSDLDSEQKALLSNASTGGDFYTFSGLFVNIGGSFDIPSWMGGAEKTIYRTFEGMYGEDNLFVAAFTPAQRYGASSDYGVIAGGGNLGGGGSSDGDYFVWTKRYTDYGERIPLIWGSDTVKQQYIKWVTNNNALENRGILTINGNMQQMNAWRVPDSYELVYGDDGKILGLKNTSGHSYTIENCFNGTTYTSNWGTDNKIVNITVTNVASFGYDHTVAAGGVYSFDNVQYVYESQNIGNGGFIPDTNWPDDDNVVPTQPDIPEPQEPVIDEQPAQPIPEPTPTYPTYTTVFVNDFTVDIQGILDAMDEHCGHLQEALWWNFNNFWQRLSTKLTNDFATLRTFLSQQISWIVSSVDSMFESLKDYLEDLAEWLRDELDYIIGDSAYDDNTLLSWLRRIYYKLGSGKVSTKPVDPNANPDDVGDWISQLFANLFTALDDLAGGLLTSLATLLGGLVTKFPFSIPWDVAAILGLLVAEPVAPAIEFPVYTLSSGELVQVGTMNIDMDAWTPYLTGIHMMIRVSFILFLMLKTKDFMTIMEKAVGLDA